MDHEDELTPDTYYSNAFSPIHSSGGLSAEALKQKCFLTVFKKLQICCVVCCSRLSVLLSNVTVWRKTHFDLMHIGPASSWYLNKGWPTRWYLHYYILLNMFQTLIRLKHVEQYIIKQVSSSWSTFIQTQFDVEIQTRPSYELLLSAVLQRIEWNECCWNRETDLSTRQFYGLQPQWNNFRRNTSSR